MVIDVSEFSLKNSTETNCLLGSDMMDTLADMMDQLT